MDGERIEASPETPKSWTAQTPSRLRHRLRWRLPAAMEAQEAAPNPELGRSPGATPCEEGEEAPRIACEKKEEKEEEEPDLPEAKQVQPEEREDVKDWKRRKEEELQRREIFKAAMLKEKQAQEAFSPPPRTVEMPEEGADEATAFSPRALTFRRPLAASPMAGRLAPRSPPPKSPSPRLTAPLPFAEKPSRLSPPASPQPSGLSPELPSALPSHYERFAKREDWDRTSQASWASDQDYAKDVKAARANLKARKGSKEKYDRTKSPSTVPLSPANSQLFSPSSSFLFPPSPASPQVSPLGKGFSQSFSFNRNDTGLTAQLSTQLSSQQSGSLAQPAADADDDEYDSNDEQAMLSRYAQRCNPEKIYKVRSALLQLGHQIPSQKEEVEQEVQAYQQTMQDRLTRLGVSGPGGASTVSADPSEAVKDALLRYHSACEKLGKLYAFEKPKRDAPPDMEARRQIARFVRDLKEADPDRYGPTEARRVSVIQVEPLIEPTQELLL